MLSGICILISKFKKTIFLKNRIIQRKQSNSNSPSFILCQLLFSEKSRINAQTKKMGPLGPLILIRLEPILPLCPRHCRVDRKHRICSVFQTNQRERGQKTQLRSFIRTHCSNHSDNEWLKPSLPPAPKLVEGMPRDIGTFWSVEALMYSVSSMPNAI